MFKDTNFITKENKDFGDVVYYANPALSPFLTLLLQKGRTKKAVDTIINKKVVDMVGVEVNSGVAEGAAWSENDAVVPTYVTNYTQRFDTSIKISNTARAVAGANQTDLIVTETKLRTAALKREIDKAILTGTTEVLVGGGHKMNGIDKLSTQKTFATSLTLAVLNDAFLHLYNHGQIGDVYLVCNPANKLALDNLLKEGFVINGNNGLTQLGISVFSYITSTGMTVNILMDVNMPVGEYLVVDLDAVEVPVLIGVTAYAQDSSAGSSTGMALETELSIMANTTNSVYIKKAV